ncbi:GntR family transcriptional regulator [Aurantimonas sp. C2-6-R+9]|uniref:GntR family transcriptional regulator n=1 Tax=unclassified Aurantimonas TaxID=2638230 RepID=UPI002E17ECF3|nr:MULTISPECIES: GntR family transcriptional regulator [unclassified Aurantimonas]MEC5293245.1 GntR family transcriptional regulator [Aurantimonas sp. C2-3-R2]MEC5383385.1 GntR family transcriptional regulator [Aurantimonas sp. C2-6-R+9]MEC5414339.1 GntR family transcriptional regulator [Aurantimonas sp. C2-4-R8]
MIFETLRNQIADGTLPEGLILEAAPLARFFGLSRTPVTEALLALADAGLAWIGEGRGVVVGRGGTSFRCDPTEAGLSLPPSARRTLSERNWRSRFYPEVEQEISSCLPFGLFAINVTHLAASKAVSRTIAHEALVRLERLGLIEQRGSRWYAGQMTENDILEHYEIRWLLEPQALAASAPTLPRDLLLAARERAIGCLDRSVDGRIELVDRLERDLHLDIVLHAPSRLMADAIRRSQLPLMATNFSLNHQRDYNVRRQMIVEHLAVLDALVASDAAAAAAALEAHLRSAPNFVREALHSKTTPYVPPGYMTRIE